MRSLEENWPLVLVTGQYTLPRVDFEGRLSRVRFD